MTYLNYRGLSMKFHEVKSLIQLRTFEQFEQNRYAAFGRCYFTKFTQLSR
jgi:hypothetical protein